jgi:hypothetical protein
MYFFRLRQMSKLYITLPKKTIQHHWDLKKGNMLTFWVQQVESQNSKEGEQSKYDQLAFECSNGVLIHHPSV